MLSWRELRDGKDIDGKQLSADQDDHDIGNVANELMLMLEVYSPVVHCEFG